MPARVSSSLQTLTLRSILRSVLTVVFLMRNFSPSKSADSESIAFQGYDDGVWHIYVISREGGEPKRLTSGEFDDREPAWSHDSTRLAFSCQVILYQRPRSPSMSP